MNNELFEYEIVNDSVTILKYIGNQANVVIPPEIDGKPVTKIGNSAFRECVFLTYVEIPDSVTEIESYAFSGCSSLKSILLPEGLTKLGDRAFGTSIRSASIPKRRPIDVGNNNFQNLTVVVHCKCGQIFAFDPDSNEIPACPRCGKSNQYKVVPPGGSLLFKLFAFIGSLLGSLSLAAMGLKDDQTFVRCSLIVVLSAFAALVIDGFRQLSYLFFKLSTDPNIPKQKRPNINIAPEVNAFAASSPVKSVSGISESSSAPTGNAGKNSTGEEKPLFSFLEQLNTSENPSQLPPLSPYFHSNAVGCAQLPGFIVMGVLTISLLMVATTQSGAEAGFMFVMAAIMGFFLFILLRLEIPTLRISADEKGIQCNRIKPQLIPWESIRNFSFRTSPILLFAIPVQTNLKITIVFKDRHTRTIVTRFNSELEATQCQKTLEEYCRRAKFLASQSQDENASQNEQ